MKDGRQFFKVYQDYLEDDSLTIAQAVLLSLIESLSQHTGYCFATSKKIGELLGIKRVQIQKHLKSLSDKNYIEITGESNFDRRIYLVSKKNNLVYEKNIFSIQKDTIILDNILDKELEYIYSEESSLGRAASPPLCSPCKFEIKRIGTSEDSQEPSYGGLPHLSPLKTKKMNFLKNSPAEISLLKSKKMTKMSGEFFRSVIDYLNKVTGRNYGYIDSHKKYISARYNQGFKSLNDYKQVIDVKYHDWKNSDMKKFLRPQTLFGSKFDSYLNEDIPVELKAKYEIERQRTELLSKRDEFFKVKNIPHTEENYTKFKIKVSKLSKEMLKQYLWDASKVS